jgi:signal transduction histidine kinase
MGSSVEDKPNRPAEAALAVAPLDTAPLDTAEQLAERFRRRLLRLAADVHDGPMQDLTAIGFGMQGLRRKLAREISETRRGTIDSLFDDLLSECEQVERSLRSLISSLEGGLVETSSLADAITDEVENFRRRSDVFAELLIDEGAEAATDSQRIALQAVTREALANVGRHANAMSVVVRLEAVGEGLRLSICDDGVGFDVAAAGRTRRLGLNGMRTRITLLGGELRMESAPGGPTTVTATLEPWRPEAA